MKHVKRFVITGSSLPQDVILSAVKSVQSNLTAELSDCCNATLDAVSAAVVAVEPTDDATSDGVFPKWAIPVVIVAGVLAVALLAAIAATVKLW